MLWTISVDQPIGSGVTVKAYLFPQKCPVVYIFIGFTSGTAAHELTTILDRVPKDGTENHHHLLQNGHDSPTVELQLLEEGDVNDERDFVALLNINPAYTTSSQFVNERDIEELCIAGSNAAYNETGQITVLFFTVSTLQTSSLLLIPSQSITI